MKTMIIGAGALGKYLAATFCQDKHDVIVIDVSATTLQRLKDKHDVMTMLGDGASASILQKAGVAKVDLMIAVSNDDLTNIHACQIATHYGKAKTICRLSTMDYFSEKDGFTPEKLGIGHVIVPKEECVHKIINVLDKKTVLEKILFSVPDALMTAFEVLPSSPLSGLRIKDFPDIDLIHFVRFSAIVRDNQLLTPHGDTIVVPGDEVYVAGPADKVNAMIDWANPDSAKISRIIIVGATIIGAHLSKELGRLGFDVRMVEKSLPKGEEVLEGLDSGMMVINGDPTESDVLEEVGVSTCDAFISAMDDDESNILSGILAKKLGAKKVIAITNKAEYIDIVPTMRMIDCGFSVRLVAVNSILRYIDAGTVHTDAVLHRANAYVSEFEVMPNSPLCDKKIGECDCPPTAVFSLVFRDGKVLAPSGDLVLKAGDLVAAIATPETIKSLEPLFIKKGLFQL